MWPTSKFEHLGVTYTPGIQVADDDLMVVARPDLFTDKKPATAATKQKES